MCHRMSPLLFSELERALEEFRRTGRARVPRRSPGTVVPDAYPGTQIPLFVPNEDGELVPTMLTWGFPTVQQTTGKPALIFNTRIETALPQGQSGKGIWADAIRYGRCLVPVRCFYERWTQPHDPAQEGTNEVRFQLMGHRIFLIACVCNDERFSVVTTQPNAMVSPVHNRMPLVLGPGESSIWLGPDYGWLSDRSGIQLTSQVEMPQRHAATDTDVPATI